MPERYKRAPAATDEKRERRPGRFLGSACHVDENLRHGRIVDGLPCVYLGRTLATRIQICGRVVATVEDRRIEPDLPGRQGRLLFVYLVCSRLRETSRHELMSALWLQPPPAADSALSALVSKLRRLVQIDGRSELRLVLARDAFVDLEAAEEAVHRAESAVRRGTWVEAWAPARIALHTASRGFLAGDDLPWVDERRRHLDDLQLRAHECVAAAGIGLGGTELDSALRSGRALVELAPLRESGYRLLMRALVAEGNAAEALAVYDSLRIRLRDELGTAPGPVTQELYRTLIG
jgi:DNA-binding SARP family transcriptional activator